MIPMVDHALAYARQGWAVLPLFEVRDDGRCSCGEHPCTKKPGKHPRIQRWHTEAATDEGQIRAWWTNWPNANIGIATGAKSGIVVIDLDVPTGLETWAALDQGGDTPLVGRTGSGGLHLVYQDPGNVQTQTGKLGVKVDVRGDGGFIVAPPSNHVSGQRYEWLDQTNPPACPVWLAALLPKRGSKSLPNVDAGPYVVPQEQRRGLTLAELQAFHLSISAMQTEETKATARDVLAIIEGRAWGQPGGRDEALHKLCYRLLLAHPWLDPDNTSWLFMRSCVAVEREDGTPTNTAWVAQKLAQKIAPAAQALAADAMRQAEHKAYVDAQRLTELARTAPKGVQDTLRKIRDGEPWADGAGPEAHLAVNEAARYVANKLPGVDVDQLVKLAAPAFAAQNLSMDALTVPLNHEISKVLAAQDAKLEETAKTERSYIQKAFGTDRVEPYTPEELELMAPHGHMWIIAVEDKYFIRGPYGYQGPYGANPATKCRDLLAPARTAGVELYNLNEKNRSNTLKPFPDMLEAYGTVASPNALRYDYREAKPRVELASEGRVHLRMPAGRMKDLVPVYDADIATWLEFVGGDRHDQLLDWIATAHLLDRPTAALYVTGPTGLGKTFLAQGLASMYEGGEAVKFKDALSPFNVQLLYQPIILADETIELPEGSKAKPIDVLRTMVTDASRRVADKNVKASTLEGQVRLILCANNTGALKMGSGMWVPTMEDIRAVEGRLLMLRPTNGGVEWLASKGGYDFTVPWLNGGMAAHFRWLQTTRVVQTSDRFLVKGSGGVMEDIIFASTPAKHALQAILAAVLNEIDTYDGRPGAATKITGVRRAAQLKQGDCWVRMSDVLSLWSQLSQEDRLDDPRAAFDLLYRDEPMVMQRWGGTDPVRQKRICSGLLERAAKEAGLEDALALAVAKSQDVT